MMSRITFSAFPRLPTPLYKHKESAVEGSISQAIGGFKLRKFPSIRQAAEYQGLAYSTLYCRLKGRQPRRKAHGLDQILGEPEERAIVRQNEDIHHREFPIRVAHVREIAIRLLAEREDSQFGKALDL